MRPEDTIFVNHIPTIGDISSGGFESFGIGDTPAENLKPGAETPRNLDMAQRGVVNNWVINNLRQGSDPAILNWQFSGTFSSTDSDTVSWTSGTLTLSDGSVYSIVAGNTGNMTALTYIYFDKNKSTTAFQTTTTAGNAVGTGKILLGTAKPVVTTVVQYEADAVPSSSDPAWTTNTNGSPTEEISPAGFLHILCDPSSEDYWTRITNDNAFNTHSNGFSVKARIKIIQGDTGTAGSGIDLSISNNGSGSSYGTNINFRTDGVNLWDDDSGGVNHAMDTTDDYHIYEAVINTSTGKVDYYIDGVFIIQHDAETASDPFGWGTESVVFEVTENVVAEVSVDYIYTQTHANGYDPTSSQVATFQIYGGSGGGSFDIPDRSITNIKLVEKTLTVDEIADGTITAALLDATNTEADNDILTYDSASGGFTFNTPSEIITAGTNLTWAGAQLDVDDAFLLNNGDVGTGAYDFGGADSLEIPNAAGGKTIDADGEVCVDTTAKTLNFHDGNAEEVLNPIQSKSFTVDSPGASEDVSLFFEDNAVTIVKMVAVLVGSSTPSVTWTIRHGTDRSATGAEVVTSGTTTTSTSTGSVVTSFNDATIVANSFVWLETTAQSGTVNSINVTIFYKQDA